eukprot:2553473-Pyramimonas_sp.AAC.1
MLGIIQKGGSRDKIIWAFAAVEDLYLSGAMTADEFPVSAFTGKKRQAGGGAPLCLADLLCFKYEIKEHFLAP